MKKRTVCLCIFVVCCTASCASANESATRVCYNVAQEHGKIDAVRKLSCGVIITEENGFRFLRRAGLNSLFAYMGLYCQPVTKQNGDTHDSTSSISHNTAIVFNHSLPHNTIPIDSKARNQIPDKANKNGLSIII